MGLFSNKHLLIKTTREHIVTKVSLWEKSGLLENVDIKLKASLAGMSESFNVNSFLRYVLIEDVNKDKVIKFKKFYK